ncbi:MAG: invasion associated locus B family protein [Pararhodobacter sp.]
MRFPFSSGTILPVLGTGFLSLALAMPATLSAQETSPQLPAEVTEPQPGEPYSVATHQDWEVLCTRFTEGGPEMCEIYQLLLGEDDTPLAEISVALLPDEEEFSVGATITTPLETFLLPGMAWQIGAEGELRNEPFQVCNPIGCIALLGLEDDEVDQMRRGAEAFVLFRPFTAPDQVIGARVSLMGFTAALNDLEQRTSPEAGTED